MTERAQRRTPDFIAKKKISSKQSTYVIRIRREGYAYFLKLFTRIVYKTGLDREKEYSGQPTWTKECVP